MPVGKCDPTGTVDETYSTSPVWICDGRYRGRITLKKWDNFHDSVATVRDDLETVSTSDATRMGVDYSSVLLVKRNLNASWFDECLHESNVKSAVKSHVGKPLQGHWLPNLATTVII